MFSYFFRIVLIFVLSLLVSCGGGSTSDLTRDDDFQNITPVLLLGKTFYYSYKNDSLTIFEKLSVTNTDTLKLDTILHDSITGDSGLAGDFSYSLSNGNLTIPLAADKQMVFKLKAISIAYWLVEMTSGDDVEPLELKLYFKRPSGFPLDIK